MWHDTMLAQFHDCLPGTTISMVVNDNLDIYKTRREQARGLIETALKALAGSSPTKHITSIESTHVVDPQRLKRNESIKLDSGEVAWLQTDSNGIGKLSTAGPDSGSTMRSPQAKQEGDTYTLSNSRFRLTMKAGRFTSLVDLSLDRELILPGPGAEDGGLMLYEDYPLAYDAWDVEIYHLQSYDTIKFDEVRVEQGDLRASLVATARFGKSTATMTVSIGFPSSLEGCAVP